VPGKGMLQAGLGAPQLRQHRQEREVVI
jgi:hypothetical protein